MKYDDASWHYEGDYPDDLPQENAAIHIGFFLKWCICNNHFSEELIEDSEDEVKKVQNGCMTGAQFLLVYDGKLVDDMLSETGNLFAMSYYQSEEKFSEKYGSYGDDFCDVFNLRAEENGFEYASLYHVEDTKENYDLMATKIDERFQQWIIFNEK